MMTPQAKFAEVFDRWASKTASFIGLNVLNPYFKVTTKTIVSGIILALSLFCSLQTIFRESNDPLHTILCIVDFITVVQVIDPNQFCWSIHVISCVSYVGHSEDFILLLATNNIHSAATALGSHLQTQWYSYTELRSCRKMCENFCAIAKDVFLFVLWHGHWIDDSSFYQFLYCWWIAIVDRSANHGRGFINNIWVYYNYRLGHNSMHYFHTVIHVHRFYVPSVCVQCATILWPDSPSDGPIEQFACGQNEIEGYSVH